MPCNNLHYTIPGYTYTGKGNSNCNAMMTQTSSISLNGVPHAVATTVPYLVAVITATKGYINDNKITSTSDYGLYRFIDIVTHVHGSTAQN
jgi:hypothetical protein